RDFEFKLRCELEESPEQFLHRCIKKFPSTPKTLPEITIRKGVSPVLLSPMVVEMICFQIANQTRLGRNWNPKIAQAIPPGFELTEDPQLPQGLFSAPFDDEGTPTRSKTLCRGPERISQYSDLELAAQHSQKSSGNGFRKGRFVGQPS